MTTRPCPLQGCGAQLADGVEICAGCASRLRLRLLDVPGLLAELDTTMSRQGTAREPSGDTCPTGCGHDPDSPTCRQGVSLDLDEGASQASLAIRTCLHGWIRVWDEETPIPDGARLASGASARAARDRLLATAEGQAAVLARLRLASRSWAPDLAREIGDAYAAGVRAIDRAPDRVFVGWCPDLCRAALYATSGALQARCRRCGRAWDVESSRAALLADADGYSAPAADLARAISVPAGTIRSWRSTGRLQQATDNQGGPAYNPAGQPLYRVSDVRALALGNKPVVSERRAAPGANGPGGGS